MPSDVPYGDLEIPGAEDSIGGNTWAHYTGLAAVTEFGGRLHPSLNGAAWLGYHVAAMEDYYLGGGLGRYFTLFTPNDYQNGTDLTKGAFHSSERRLLGGFDPSNGEPLPDLSVMHNTVFASDGKGRWLAGSAPVGFAFLDDGGSFTDESADAASLATNDVQLTPSAAVAVNDAFYIGAAATFAGFWMDQTTAITIGSGGTALTLALEYWDGSAWSAVTQDSNQDTPNTLASPALTRAQQHRVTWSHASQMSDWATTTVNGQSAYWVRLRVTTGASGSGYAQAKARSIYLIQDNTSKNPLLPPAYYVGDDPGTTAPIIKGWGLHRLGVNGTQQVAVASTSGGFTVGTYNVWYTWYDSTRKIESEPVNLGAITTVSGTSALQFTIGDHPDPNVDKLRAYIAGAGQYDSSTNRIVFEPQYEGDPVNIGVGLLRLVGEFTLSGGTTFTVTDLIGGGSGNDRTTAWTTIDRSRVGDGPYLASTIDNPVGLRPDVAAADGHYETNCVHKGRVYCAGTRVSGYQFRVVWSIANVPECFPKDNFVDVPMSDGDRIIAIRSAGASVVVLGARSCWAISGDPESSNISVSKIADVGCLAKRSAITVGQRCFFLGAAGIYAVGSGGSVELVTTGLTRLFRDLWDTNAIVYQGSTLYQHAVHQACAGYDPSREFVVFAIPGLLRQTTGGRALNRVVNDAMIQINLITGRATILAGDFPSAFAAVPTGNSGVELWFGNTKGRLKRLTTDTLDTNATAAISGTVAGTHSATTLQDTGLSLTASSSDTSFVGEMLTKSNAAGTVWESRMIISNTTDAFTINDAWTNDPVDGDLYYIGQYFLSAETGDLTDVDPGEEHRLVDARLHLEDGMNSANELTVGSTDDPHSGTTTYTYSGNLSASKPVEKLPLGHSGGYFQRFRVLARMGGARFRLFAVALHRTLMGRKQ